MPASVSPASAGPPVTRTTIRLCISVKDATSYIDGKGLFEEIHQTAVRCDCDGRRRRNDCARGCLVIAHFRFRWCFFVLNNGALHHLSTGAYGAKWLPFHRPARPLCWPKRRNGRVRATVKSGRRPERPGGATRWARRRMRRPAIRERSL